MANNEMRDNPLIQPKLVRMLKQRSRLIDLGIREEVLDQLDNRMCQRRSPRHIAERLSDTVVNEASDATRPVMRDRVEKKVDEINNKMLSDL